MSKVSRIIWVGLALLLAFTSMPIWAWSPSWPVVYLTWEDDPCSTMTVHWITPTCKGSWDHIQYRQIGSPDWSRSVARCDCLPNSHYALHHVTLSELAPDAIYSFRLGGSTKEHRFRTMPAELSRPVTFVEGGDFYHGRLSEALDTTFQASLQDPDFAVIGGDLAYSAPRFSFTSESPYRWLRWLEMWQKVMRTSDGRMVPLITAIGNHEVSGRFYRTPKDAVQYYALFRPQNQTSYHALDFGDYLSLFILDSGHTSSVCGPQSEWLAQALGKRPSITHRMAVYHVPAWPSCRSMGHKTSPEIRATWVPLFEQHKLHLAFEHHDHGYKRTHSLKGGTIDPEGIVYMGDGAWGCTPREAESRWYLAKTAAVQHFICTRLSGEKRAFSVIDKQGKQIDYVEMHVEVDV